MKCPSTTTIFLLQSHPFQSYYKVLEGELGGLVFTELEGPLPQAFIHSFFSIDLP
ncbi:hypothetical protein Hdeb2414_s0005g00157191 [Helianthus debilis subsp. tardiflorus]